MHSSVIPAGLCVPWCPASDLALLCTLSAQRPREEGVQPSRALAQSPLNSSFLSQSKQKPNPQQGSPVLL